MKEFKEFKEKRIKHRNTGVHSKRIKRNTFLKSNNPNIRINKNQEGKSWCQSEFTKDIEVAEENWSWNEDGIEKMKYLIRKHRICLNSRMG